MAETEMTRISDPLDLIVYPNDYLGSSDETYRTLLAVLDLGWQVERPDYLYPRWDGDDLLVFPFFLKQDLQSQTSLVITLQSPAIERLVTEEGWQVVRYPGR
jgi:hypothetical protein